MKTKFKSILKNISYSFSVNLLSALISAMMILLLPKVMSAEDYGAWQLYLFFLSYVGFFHFGWIDGIYLRYGGIEYNALNKRTFSGQFYALAIMVSTIASVFIVFAIFFTTKEITRNALQMVSVVGVFVILTTFTNFILQFTSRIKDYARLIFYERMLFFLIIVSYVVMGRTEYEGMLWVSFSTRLLALIYAGFLIKEIIGSKLDHLSNVVKEAIININVGSKLMIANIAGMLLLGIIRLGISQQWDIVTFGKVSLTLNVSNFLMIFISSISIVLFPILKRTDESQLPQIYMILRNCLTVVLLGLLIIYYPIKVVMSIWLPKYADSLVYMAVLFPVCLFESKVSMLINTYLKSLRQEQLLLRINSISVIVSLFFTMVTVYWLHDLDMAVISIVAVFAFRCMLAEYFLGLHLNLNLYKDMCLDSIMVIWFIGINWFFDNWWSMGWYMAAYVLYLWVKKDDLRKVIAISGEYVRK